MLDKGLMMLKPYLGRFSLLARQVISISCVSWFWSVSDDTSAFFFFLHAIWLLSGSYWSRVNLTCWSYDGFSCCLWEFQKVMLPWGYNFPASVFSAFTSEVGRVNSISTWFQESNVWHQDINVFEMLLNWILLPSWLRRRLLIQVWDLWWRGDSCTGILKFTSWFWNCHT